MMDLAMNFDTDECLVTAMFDKGNSLSHLFQIGEFDFLSIGFTLLCFDTGL